MGASDDEDEYITYGRPLQEELESSKGQYSKEIQDKSVTRALPVWQQEVVDEQGRRRLHGAFTGGYSAGYYNTVGSKEGWVPSTFKSSRDKRSEPRTQQTAEDFMDEDELEDLGRRKIATVSDFDTFGHEAEERAKHEMLAGAQERPGLPTGVIKDLIALVPDSVGIRLLQKMGWRQGKGIGKAHAKKTGESGSKWGQMASLGSENVKIYQLASKDDTHGLGHDPFKGAQEFKAAREERIKDPRKEIPGKRKRGVAFGTGIMDEDDVMGMTDDYVTDLDPREGFDFELHSEDEDDQPVQRHQVRDQYRLPGKADPLRLKSREDAARGFDMVPGFVKAKIVETFPHFPPPKIPAGFQELHRFPADNSLGGEVGSEPPLPSGAVLRAIRSIAPFVARMGPSFEALAVQKNSQNPEFGFLSGGEGADYYRWSVRALRAAQQDTTGLVIGQRSKPLTANARGVLLGETDAQAAHPLQDPDPTLTRHQPAGIAEGDKKALQEAMRATFTRGKKQDLENTNPDLKDFGLRAGSAPRPPLLAQTPQSAAAQGILNAGKNRFSSGTILAPEPAEGGLMAAKPTAASPVKKEEVRRLPTRTVVEWRPATLLCKRFNVPDPFRGKPAQEAEAPKSKFDSLSLPETAAREASRAAAMPMSHHFGQTNQMGQIQGTAAEILPLPPLPARPQASQENPKSNPSENPMNQLPAAAQNTPGDLADSLLSSLLGTPPEIEGASTGVGSSATLPTTEKPINLFQAIFEDDSDDDEDSDEAPDTAEAPTPPAVPPGGATVSDPGLVFHGHAAAGLGSHEMGDRMDSSVPFGKVRTGEGGSGPALRPGLSGPVYGAELGNDTRDEKHGFANIPVLKSGEGQTSPSQVEIQEPLRLLKKSNKKDKKKKSDKKEKKSKSSKHEKKHHKSRRD